MIFLKQKERYIRFLIYLFLATTTVSYGTDSFLENVTLINWITLFSFFLLLVIVPFNLSVGNKKVTTIVLSFFVLMSMAGEVEEWIKEYTPSVGYHNQSPCEYGEYLEDRQITCVKDKNISNILHPYADSFIVATNNTIHEINYNSNFNKEYAEVVFKCMSRVVKEHINKDKVISLGDKLFVLDENNKTLNVYKHIYDQELKNMVFISINHIDFPIHLHNEYIQKIQNGEPIDGSNYQNMINTYECNSSVVNSIIIDKLHKQFYLCYDGIKRKTTTLKNIPSIAAYLADYDTVLMAYQDKKGLYVLKNKYEKEYIKIQDSITKLLKVLNQPKWDKPDLKKLGYKLKKLKKLIDIFKPYEKNQYHSVEYKVVNYDGLQAKVKVDIDTEFTFFFYLSKEKENWNIKEIE